MSHKIYKIFYNFPLKNAFLIKFIKKCAFLSFFLIFISLISGINVVNSGLPLNSLIPLIPLHEENSAPSGN